MKLGWKLTAQWPSLKKAIRVSGKSPAKSLRSWRGSCVGGALRDVIGYMWVFKQQSQNGIYYDILGYVIIGLKIENLQEIIVLRTKYAGFLRF